MTNKNWTITTAEAKTHWLTKPYVPTDLRDQLQTVDILLLPQEGFRDFEGPLYPVGTEEFLTSLQDAESGLSVDVVVSNADYKELALHADCLILAQMFITIGVVPTAVNLISEYLKRRIWPDDSKRGVKVKVLVEQRDGDASKCVEVSYEGPANEFADSMKAVLGELRGQGFQTPEETESIERPTAELKAGEAPNANIEHEVADK